MLFTSSTATTMKLLTCKLCGKEYDAHTYGAQGVVKINLAYCSEECQKEARRNRDRARNERKKKELLALRGMGKADKAKPTSTAHLIERFGPPAGSQCFFCPLLGDVCRSHKLPLCAPRNRQHAQYRAAFKQEEVYG